MTQRKHKTRSENISDHEAEDIEERGRLSSRAIYEIVRIQGRDDLARPAISLWWSGLAAGLSISFSLLTQALLVSHLPNALWRPLISDLGYCVGFLMVVLARQQLFTENTITVVLPLLVRFNRANLTLTARLWSIVLTANIVGTLFAAAFCTFTPVIAPDLRQAMLDVSQQALAYGWLEMLFRAVSAGFIIATMVWLIPSAEGAQFHIVVVMTYLIALGGFTHIVAGSMEGFMLMFAGQWTVGHTAWGFLAPALIGNVIGGTALFALISYAQVMQEM